MNRFIIFIILVIVVVQVSWVVTERGNLNIYIQNQTTTIQEVDMIILLDGKEVFNKSLSPSTRLVPVKISFMEIIGFHKITISSSKSNINRTLMFNLFFVRWIIVEVFEDTVLIQEGIFPPIFE